MSSSNSKGKIPSIAVYRTTAYIAIRNCIPCKKAGISEQKYMLHSSEDYFGKRSDQKTIKEGLGGPLGSRSDAVKQYNKSKHKWKKSLKSLKKQNKMLYSISKKSGSRRELNQVKRIRDKFSKKNSYSRSNSLSRGSDSSFSSDSE